MAENEQPGKEAGNVPVARVWQQPPPVPVVPISSPPPAAPPPQPAYVSAYGGYAPPPPTSPDYAGASAFGAYTGPSKPPVVRTIGVLSIVIASISIVAAGASAVQALVHGMMMQMSQVMSTLAAAQAAQAASQAAAASQPVTAAAADGLEADERGTVVSVLTARQGLNPARQAQLDDLLSQAGQSILRLRAGAVTSDAVRRAITSTSRGRAVNAGEPGPDYITTRTGKLELYDGNGVFRPDDRTQPTIRSNADVNHYLAVTGQAGTWPPAATPGAASGTSTANATAAAVAPPVPARVRISPGPMFGVLIQCLLSLLLAIYLLVIGILTVRGSRAGWKLHLVYALIKLPLVALGVFVWWQFHAQYSTVLSAIATNASLARGGPRISPTSASILWAHASWIAVLAAVYPIALLVLLSARSVREYYRGG